MMRLYSFTPTALLLCVLLAYGPPRGTAQRPSGVITPADAAALSLSLAAFDQGHGASVATELERLAAKYPRNFAANEAAGLVHMEASEFADALPFLKRAALNDKANAAASANLGAAYLASGDAASAIPPLQRAIVLDGKNAGVQAQIGQALYRAKRAAEAAKAFAAAASLDPDNADNAYNWAVALYDLGKDREAVDALATIPAPKRIDAAESLWGDAAERQGHYQEAVEHLQNAARLNPGEGTAYAVAIELLRHWSWDTAGQVTAYGVVQYPESRRMRLANGIAAYGAGKYTDAAATFGALLVLDPGNENYGSLLGRSCSAAGGATAPECGALVQFAEAHPGNAQIDVSSAVSLLHQSSPERYFDQAQRLLERAIASDGKNAEAYYQLGVLEQQKLEWKESAASLSRAIELRPAYAEAHYRLSRAYSHTGNPEAARREIALQQQYSQQEKDDSAAKLKEITIFLMASH